ncbi:iron-regulated outer membrane virulence protein, TonB receptor family [Vibrio cholerae]|uniref:ligand-gated channel protein n=1 Tax=Vibrio cholerae TaxID=666 RepID=UPI0011D76884|nr:ligand-gated channel protein [Vibrio cholerae]EGR0603477.1 ligand-gated channel protein [Vibrio cholerae]TXY56884.1 ligand-gated channel protein [Vibrio cholerae]TXY62963.1 ligand-gated channel protein [Vibrio cholerae]GHX29393.1 iron-regulated outer membrane virulence protein, TonB receptor family [Vibrio cholerae]GHX96566.1 iron-regulated outer membrane virulence protein, TonB receptor family [Vibrio cholerae]
MSRFNPSPVSLSVALGLMFSASAFAQDTTKIDETMVVTAAGFSQAIQNAPASISVISREDLESRYYRDVTDALKNVPGVTVTGGGDNTDISIRGMGSNYTLILVDGKRQTSRQTRPNSDGPGIEQGWLPPLQAIERIEVIRGPMSTLYGSDAIGGVINIITRKDQQQWSGNVQLSTVVQENRASGDEQSANFFVTGPLSDALSLQVYGQTTQRDEDEIEHGYGDKSLRSLTSKLNYQLNPDHQLQLEAGVSAQDRENNVGKSAQSSGSKTDNEYRRNHIAVSHQGDWQDVGQSDTYLQYEENTNKSREMSIDNTVFKSTLVAPIGEHMLSFGVEGKHESLEDKTSNKISSRTHISNTQWAGFIEDEWALAEQFRLTFGGRLDHDKNYGSHFSPRVYGVWNLDSAWTVKGGVSTGFRAPQLREVTQDWGQVSRGGNIYGNPDLQPETSINKELSLGYLSDTGLSASLTAFHNDFKDKITRVKCPDSICTSGKNQFGADPTYRVNIDEAETYGAEAEFGFPITDTIDFGSSYTYTRSEQKTGEFAGKPLEKLPKHLFSSSLNWQTTDRLSSWTNLNYRGKEVQSNGSASSSKKMAPSYTFIDAGITYALTDTATIKAAVYNLFDQDVNYAEYDYVEDGRRYWLGLDIAF